MAELLFVFYDEGLERVTFILSERHAILEALGGSAMKRLVTLGARVARSNFGRNARPFKLTLIVTWTCDARCRMCNIWQRPEEHHRKDLTAAPVWTEDSYPALKLRNQELRDMFRGVERSMNWSDVSIRHPSMRKGYWQRAWLFGNHDLNPKLAALFQPAQLKRVHEIITEIRLGNDAYDWGCNGSIMIEMWRISGGPEALSDKMLGATNLVLQMVTPIRGDRSIVFQLGEDTSQLDPAVAGDTLVFDDSFEHRFFLEGTRVPEAGAVIAGVEAPMSNHAGNDVVLLHVQLCHPEMHEKALDPPGKYCADSEWE